MDHGPQNMISLLLFYEQKISEIPTKRKDAKVTTLI